MKTIIEKLAPLRENQEEPFFETGIKEWSKKDVIAIEMLMDVTFPEDYKEVLLNFGAGLIEGEGDALTFFSKEEFFEEERIAKSDKFEDAFVFAYDNAGEYYFYNRKSVLDYKPFSVFKVSPGALSWDSVVYLSEDLTKLLDMIIEGESFIDYDYISKH